MKLQIFHQITRGGFCPRQQSLSFIDNTVWFKNIKTTAGYQNTITAGETHTHTHFKQDEKEDPAEPGFHGDEGFSACNQPKL